MHTDTKLSKLARQILQYLREHPKAQDTLEGIMVWWVSERAIKRWLPQVRKSLVDLEIAGYLKKRNTGDGRVFYHVDSSGGSGHDKSQK